MGRGLIIAAPSSGSGKTTVTLALLRLLARSGQAARGAKSGPDYIDPRFHEAASGKACVNLDAWAMRPERLHSLAEGDGLLIIEGAMGLFDGAPPYGKGAVADLARLFDLPVLLVVDASHMAGSIAALVSGFAGHDPQVRVAGVILNKVGSDRHARMLTRALEPLGVPILGILQRDSSLAMPSRHLGLVQADEHADLERFLENAADSLAKSLDIAALLDLACTLPPSKIAERMRPPGQRIAVAWDAAFTFCYPHMLEDWRQSGAEVCLFSPLADEAVPEADFVFLPGGYPELHAGRLANNRAFLSSLKKASEDTDIYGECGGFMVLGDGLIDVDGARHAMAGLLRLETSFAARKLHLGYRMLSALGGPFQGSLTAHEFHYATTLKSEGNPVFQAWDAEGTRMADMGLHNGRVSGSFAHVIDAA